MSTREQPNWSAVPSSLQMTSPPAIAGRPGSPGIMSLDSDSQSPPWFRITIAEPKPPSSPG